MNRNENIVGNGNKIGNVIWDFVFKISVCEFTFFSHRIIKIVVGEEYLKGLDKNTQYRFSLFVIEHGYYKSFDTSGDILLNISSDKLLDIPDDRLFSVSGDRLIDISDGSKGRDIKIRKIMGSKFFGEVDWNKVFDDTYLIGKDISEYSDIRKWISENPVIGRDINVKEVIDKLYQKDLRFWVRTGCDYDSTLFIELSDSKGVSCHNYLRFVLEEIKD